MTKKSWIKSVYVVCLVVHVQDEVQVFAQFTDASYHVSCWHLAYNSRWLISGTAWITGIVSARLHQLCTCLQPVQLNAECFTRLCRFVTGMSAVMADCRCCLYLQLTRTDLLSWTQTKWTTRFGFASVKSRNFTIYLYHGGKSVALFVWNLLIFDIKPLENCRVWTVKKGHLELKLCRTVWKSVCLCCIQVCCSLDFFSVPPEPIIAKCQISHHRSLTCDAVLSQCMLLPYVLQLTSLLDG